MELKPFKDIIALSKEKLDEALAPIRARQVKAKAELKSSEIEARLIGLEKKAVELCADKDIDLDRLVDTLDEIALLERRKEQFSVVVKQLFPKGE